MDRSNPAGVAGIPGFEQGQRLGAPDFADQDTVGSQTHRGFKQPQHIDVGGRACSITRFSDRHCNSPVSSIITRCCRRNCVAISSIRALVSVVLPVLVPPHHQDIVVLPDGLAQNVALGRGHDVACHIIVQGKNLQRLASQGKNRRRDNRRY